MLNGKQESEIRPRESWRREGDRQSPSLVELCRDGFVQKAELNPSQVCTVLLLYYRNHFCISFAQQQLWKADFYHPCFTDEEVGTQRGEVIY